MDGRDLRVTPRCHSIIVVIAGLDPAIHPPSLEKKMDTRVKPACDEGERGESHAPQAKGPGMPGPFDIMTVGSD